ncbi:MAG: copper amine oxidase N-terminal domain-containing protein [Eubacteriales bacterium]|nr:copper amine oxidase N-terminal domain-containing protein [Eubacteriales bacterium]
MGKLYSNRTILGNIALVVFVAFLATLTFGSLNPAFAQTATNSGTVSIGGADKDYTVQADRSGATVTFSVTISPLTRPQFDAVTIKFFDGAGTAVGQVYGATYAQAYQQISAGVYGFVYSWVYTFAATPDYVQICIYEGPGLMERKSITLDVRTPPPSGGGAPAPAPAPTPTVPNATVVSSTAVTSQTTTTPDGKRVQTFTVQATATTDIQKAKTEGKTTVEIQIAPAATTTSTVVNIPTNVLQSAQGLNVAITTPNAMLELPPALVAALAAAGQGLSLTVESGNASTVANEVANTPGARGAVVLGTPTVIKTAIKGNTNVTLPLKGITIPADPEAKAAFLASLAVFAIHSDGEKKIISGTIVYDKDNNPIGIKFQVDKFSTFAVVKVDKLVKVITLKIGDTKATVGDQPYTLDAEPFVKAKVNRTLVPVRFIAEALDAKVEWKANTRQVVVIDGAEIVLTINSSRVLVNGLDKTLDCPAEIISSRTFVPLRFVSETLGAKVAYDAKTKEITITR